MTIKERFRQNRSRKDESYPSCLLFLSIFLQVIACHHVLKLAASSSGKDIAGACEYVSTPLTIRGP